MIIGLSLIHVQFLLVWANNGRILEQSIQWLRSELFVLNVSSEEKQEEALHMKMIRENKCTTLLTFSLHDSLILYVHI